MGRLHPPHDAAGAKLSRQKVEGTPRRTRMFVETCSRKHCAAVRRISMAALAILLLSASAQAGYITLDVPGMNAIFSQDSFDDTPISIRFNPSVTIVAP